MLKKIKDDKLKPIIPALRVKKRFIRIQIELKTKLEFKDLSRKLTTEIIKFIGEIEYSNSGFWILNDKFDFKKQELILKTKIKSKDKILAALALITKFDKESVKIRTLRVSGTLKGVFKEL